MKNVIAKKTTNSIQGISRKIATNYELELEEGQIITVENAESWTNGGAFTCELGAEYTYVFKVINEVPVHEVDYSDENEVYELGAVDENEKEVLVASGVQFKIVFVASHDDFKEMGYFQVEVECIN